MRCLPSFAYIFARYVCTTHASWIFLDHYNEGAPMIEPPPPLPNFQVSMPRVIVEFWNRVESVLGSDPCNYGCDQ